MVEHASVISCKPNVVLDSDANMGVVADNCLVMHNKNRPVNVYIYNPKDGHRSAKTVDAMGEYQGTQSGQKFILMINQAIHMNGQRSIYYAQCNAI